MDDEAWFAEERRQLLREIEAEALATRSWTGRARYADRVMAAIARVPRHEFVPEAQRRSAYANRPLAIGYGQTISQPYIVAVMTDLLDLEPTDRVLEIGTGCGYQAAVLAQVAGRVYTIEFVPELAEQARARLRRLGCRNVEVRVGDGHRGWPEEAPFDAIMVTAAPPAFPTALGTQLKLGGRMVIPVGLRDETQMLYRCVREADGGLSKEAKLPVAFVPMVESHRPA
ncbi:MAG: protein-L-isoaspartate(D-aspartate) O-methyltransferase [Rhodospirillales bacterium]